MCSLLSGRPFGGRRLDQFRASGKVSRVARNTVVCGVLFLALLVARKVTKSGILGEFEVDCNVSGNNAEFRMIGYRRHALSTVVDFASVSQPVDELVRGP